jgi:hypothetical protein
MGYTHYFDRFELVHEINTFDAFAEAVKVAFKLLPSFSVSSGGFFSEHPLQIAGGDGFGEPQIVPEWICFNGSADGESGLAHEPLMIFQDYLFDEGESEREILREMFKEAKCLCSRCVTDRKPYDFAVQITLLLYKHYFGDKVGISSDGDLSDWREAIDFVRVVFGFDAGFDANGRLEIIALEAETDVVI